MTPKAPWVQFSEGCCTERSGSGFHEGITAWINEEQDICIGFYDIGDFLCLHPHSARTLGSFLMYQGQAVLDRMQDV